MLDSVQSYIEKTAALFESSDLFYGHGTDNAFDEAVYLVFGILAIDFSTLDDLVELKLTQAEIDRLDVVVKQRLENRTPTAYLVGKAWFAGHEFISDERALVPRSPIAELISNGFAGLLSHDPASVLDMCTGSGCIGIATALQFSESKVTLVDLSEDCIELAAENVRRHGVEDRVELVCSNGFSEIGDSYDLILANPPYVSDEEYADLPSEYLKEPELGLVSPQNGLELPIKLMCDAAGHLNEGGVLIMEVGYSAGALISAFPTTPFLWLEFEYGGSGVFSLTLEQLRDFSAAFK